MATGKMNAGSIRINWLIILILIIAIGVGGAFYYSYTQLTNAITERDAAISSLQGQVASLNSQVAALQGQVKDDPQKIKSLQDQLNLSIQQVKDANDAIGQAQTQITTLKDQVSSLQDENARLRSITSLSESAVKATSVTVHLYKNTVSDIVTFDVAYAGYLVINASSSADGGYLQVSDTNTNYPFSSNKYLIAAAGSTFTIPVLPGTIDIVSGNPSTNSEGNTTITVTYYY